GPQLGKARTLQGNTLERRLLPLAEHRGWLFRRKRTSLTTPPESSKQGSQTIGAEQGWSLTHASPLANQPAHPANNENASTPKEAYMLPAKRKPAIAATKTIAVSARLLRSGGDTGI